MLTTIIDQSSNHLDHHDDFDDDHDFDDGSGGFDDDQYMRFLVHICFLESFRAGSFKLNFASNLALGATINVLLIRFSS